MINNFLQSVTNNMTPKPLKQDKNPLQKFRPLVSKRDYDDAYNNSARFMNRRATNRHMTYNSYGEVRRLAIARSLN